MFSTLAETCFAEIYSYLNCHPRIADILMSVVQPLVYAAGILQGMSRVHTKYSWMLRLHFGESRVKSHVARQFPVN